MAVRTILAGICNRRRKESQLADVSENSLRVIALIDLLDLQWQLKWSGGADGPDLARVVGQLEAGVVKLGGVPTSGPALADIYLYGPVQPERSTEDRRMVFHPRGAAVDSACLSCSGPCTHCKGGATGGGGMGRENPIHADLLGLAREDPHDWAVLVSTDVLLIPAIRYLQSQGLKIVHGCFPPIAMDLTKECWASIDLGEVLRGSD